MGSSTLYSLNSHGMGVFSGVMHVYVAELFRQFWRPLPYAQANSVGELRSWLQFIPFLLAFG